MSSGSTVIDTARLRLTPIDRRHASDLHALWIEPDVRRYLWDEAIVPMSQTDDIVLDQCCEIPRARRRLVPGCR